MELARLAGRQYLAVHQLTSSFIDDRSYKLLIVDSIMNLFR